MRSALWRIRFKLESLIKREEGQDLVEYALVIALVSVAAVVSLGKVTTAVTNVFSKIVGDL